MSQTDRLRFVGFAVFGGGVTLLLLLAIPQLALIRSVSELTVLTGGQKFLVILEALQSSFTSIPGLHQVIMACIVILAGMNTGLAAGLLQKRRSASSAHAAGMAGVVAAILGAGCSACGSVALVSIIGLTAASPLLASLPFHGFEFSIASILLSVAALALLIRETKAVASCPLPVVDHK